MKLCKRTWSGFEDQKKLVYSLEKIHPVNRAEQATLNGILICCVDGDLQRFAVADGFRSRLKWRVTGHRAWNRAAFCSLLRFELQRRAVLHSNAELKMWTGRVVPKTNVHVT
jgi:hypothetical protein